MGVRAGTEGVVQGVDEVNPVARETDHEIGQLRRSAGTMVSVTVQTRVNSAEREVECEMRDAGSCSVAFELLHLHLHLHRPSRSCAKPICAKKSWKPKLAEELRRRIT